MEKNFTQNQGKYIRVKDINGEDLKLGKGGQGYVYKVVGQIDKREYAQKRYEKENKS